MRLDGDVAGGEAVNSDDASDDGYGEQHPLRGREELLSLFLARDVVEDRSRGVDDEAEQQELGPAGKQQEDRIDRRQDRDDRVLAEVAGIALVSLLRGTPASTQRPPRGNRGSATGGCTATRRR